MNGFDMLLGSANNFDTLLNERYQSPNKVDEAILGKLRHSSGAEQIDEYTQNMINTQLGKPKVKKVQATKPASKLSKIARRVSRTASAVSQSKVGRAAGAAAKTARRAGKGAVQGARAAKAGGATRKRDIIKGALGGATKKAIVNPVARRVAAKVAAKKSEKFKERMKLARVEKGYKDRAAAQGIDYKTGRELSDKDQQKFIDRESRKDDRRKAKAEREKAAAKGARERERGYDLVPDKEPVETERSKAGRQAAVNKARSQKPMATPGPRKLAASWNISFADLINEVSPPGFEGTVKAMKKHKEIDNPYALAWYMKNKGYKSHKNKDGTDKK